MDIAEFRKRSVPICKASKKFDKVFGIGANKTGTTTLGAIFTIIGLNLAPEAEGRILGVPFLQGKFRDLTKFIDKYDAFQDQPFSVKSVYAQLDALFPGSKFILTHRDPEEWHQSRLRFNRARWKLPMETRMTREIVAAHTHLYPGHLEFTLESNYLLDVDDALGLKVNWDLIEDKDHLIDLYVQRNKAVIRHFSERPDDLLVLDITKEKDTARIVRFLGLPDSLITSMPHLNKS